MEKEKKSAPVKSEVGSETVNGGRNVDIKCGLYVLLIDA